MLNDICFNTYNKINDSTIEIIKETANENIDLVLSELGFDIDNTTGYGNEVRHPCIIHDGDNKTAFSYNTEYKMWHCFTNKCHKEHGSSIFDLVKAILSKKQNRPVFFKEAAIWLANLLKIPVQQSNIEIDENSLIISKIIKETKFKKSIKDKIIQNNKKEKFTPVPIKTINGKIEPSKYFLDKGFSKEILKKYNVGFCDDPRKPMFLRSYFPVLNEAGSHVIGVTGRIIYEKCKICGSFHDISKNICPTDDGSIHSYPKWLHYGFSTNSVFFNSWFAKDYIKQNKTAILMEGPKDVVWAEMNGIHNSLAIFGLNVFPYHIKQLLEMGCTTVLICLDNDERGQEAAEDLNNKLGMYFKLINIKFLFKEGDDIADCSIEHLQKIIIPYLKTLEK